jgi:hypothetical protein
MKRRSKSEPYRPRGILQLNICKEQEKNRRKGADIYKNSISKRKQGHRGEISASERFTRAETYAHPVETTGLEPPVVTIWLRR